MLAPRTPPPYATLSHLLRYCEGHWPSSLPVARRSPALWTRPPVDEWRARARLPRPWVAHTTASSQVFVVGCVIAFCCFFTISIARNIVTVASVATNKVRAPPLAECGTCVVASHYLADMPRPWAPPPQ